MDTNPLSFQDVLEADLSVTVVKAAADHIVLSGANITTPTGKLFQKKCSRALKNALMQFLQRTILRCLLPTKIKSIIDFKEVRHAQFWLWTTERFRVQGSL